MAGKLLINVILFAPIDRIMINYKGPKGFVVELKLSSRAKLEFRKTSSNVFNLGFSRSRRWPSSRKAV